MAVMGYFQRAMFLRDQMNLPKTGAVMASGGMVAHVRGVAIVDLGAKPAWRAGGQRERE